MKITTKKGDKGQTGLFGGKRVSKGALVVEALGDLDELQSLLGLCKTVEGIEQGLFELIEHLQDDLYRIMSIIGYEGKCPTSCKTISDDDVDFLEVSGDEYDGRDFHEFILPGSSELNARLNLARAVCRRAERTVIKLRDSGEKISDKILMYLNRLSDLLFAIG